MFIKKIGIDLGTANTLVHVPKKGIIINEPTVVAVTIDDNKVMAVGVEAKEMLGRTPDIIVASRPLRDGVIADYRVTEALLRYFINKAIGSVRLFRPEIMVAVPAGITSTERRAVVDVVMHAGAKAAYIMKEPVAAAIGAGIPIGSASGNMIIDVGGGTSEVAVISLGGIVASSSTRTGGDKMDKAISEYIKKKQGLVIGDRTAEEIKIQIGTATFLPETEEEVIEIRGRDIIGGLPKSIEVTSTDVTDAIQEPLSEIIKTIKSVLQKTPPELAADVIDKGMILSGGGALLRNIDTKITAETGVPCYLAEDPLLCVAKGTGIALDNLETYKRSVLSTK
ncbi:rod shape-determining protein [bacterium (Candidatus Torokbacteria) CG_4_10_14_0_2_um_filter_35_8]|nr:MAG: rod shape-determining protein [bacterium (Candidatus Torokbacteria) CG_4_10_14_0_2_um_filter_35_8]